MPNAFLLSMIHTALGCYGDLLAEHDVAVDAPDYAWDRRVFEFSVNHPEGDRCFAWQWIQPDGVPRSHVVLASATVDSAEAAASWMLAQPEPWRAPHPGRPRGRRRR